MKYIILAIALLAGCGTAPPATQTINIPTYVSCVDPADMPARPIYEFGRAHGRHAGRACARTRAGLARRPQVRGAAGGCYRWLPLTGESSRFRITILVAMYP
ncbi:hypothetical protein [Duganella sp. CF517]|uniref:hypothetical protein n=1 Tax=Duganella sp. CF517 TaxID=1881038 RepID=UPI001E3AE67D|nr:hypothetical protein [Duganella sp. CF517]